MSNDPVPSTYAEVAAVLRQMATLVELGDSFEGSIEYLMPAPVEDESQPGEYPEVMLRAAFRIGNRDGQGGMRIIGTINQPPPDTSGEKTT